ncbi:hypothetical protein DYB32_009172 [Aphanomyces invadans]|nr:hypothetical protein DYB32_009172 [Aphanomyces invadans]
MSATTAPSNDIERVTTLLANLARLPSTAEQDRAIQDARPVFIRVDKDKLMQLLQEVPTAVKDRVVVASLQGDAGEIGLTAHENRGIVAAISPYFGSGMVLGLIVLVLALAIRAFNPYRELASDAAIIAHVLDKLQEDDQKSASCATQTSTSQADTPTSTSAILGKALPMPSTTLAVV